MSRELTTTRQSQGGKKGKQKPQSRSILEADKFGRMGCVQVLHIDLFYADGTKGIINVTSPHIIWGEDIETQWYHMRTYIKSQYERLGIIGFQAHSHYADVDGAIKKQWSWNPFDLIQNKEII